MTKRNKQILITAALLIAVTVLQYTFWFGKNSVTTLKETQSLIAAEDTHITELKKRNERLKAEIIDLKTVGESMEERARTELGHVKEGEVFYRVVETDAAQMYTQPATEESD